MAPTDPTYYYTVYVLCECSGSRFQLFLHRLVPETRTSLYPNGNLPILTYY
jgi:hypothetical protein